ncbi:hypothetical protein Bbelb_284240 [Branchiostoma belcheri]|nr:hypothetical protein Bbelb_284240 [Branchiostoma belcheri]
MALSVFNLLLTLHLMSQTSAITAPPVTTSEPGNEFAQLYSFDPHMLDTPKAHVESFKGSLQYQGPVLWNCLAADQRKLTSTSAFKKKNGLMARRQRRGYRVRVDQHTILGASQVYEPLYASRFFRKPEALLPQT